MHGIPCLNSFAKSKKSSESGELNHCFRIPKIRLLLCSIQNKIDHRN